MRDGLNGWVVMCPLVWTEIIERLDLLKMIQFSGIGSVSMTNMIEKSDLILNLSELLDDLSN